MTIKKGATTCGWPYGILGGLSFDPFESQFRFVVGGKIIQWTR